jgi:hypothetical protein
MKNWYCIVAALVVAACALSPAAAMPGDAAAPGVGASQGSIMAVRAQVRSLELELGAIENRVDVAEEAVHIAEQSHQAGIGPSSDVTASKLELQQLQIQLLQLQAVLANARRLVKLADPVDIDLKDADIRKAAEALSRVSGLKIAVADSVPKDVVVTAQAKSVPLGAILEVIANAANLAIAPDEPGGVVLRPTGKLMINGKEVNLSGRPAYDTGNPPWSDEWGASAASSNVTLGRRWLNLFSGTTRQSIVIDSGAPATKTE